MNPDLLSAYRFHRAKTLRTGTIRAADALQIARGDVAANVQRYDSTDYGPGTRQRSRADSPSWVKDAPEMFALHDATGQGAFRKVGDVATEWNRFGGGWFERHPARNGWHGGWFTDPYGDVMKDGTGLCWGVVYQMPGHKGATRFVAGYEYGGMDQGVTLDLSRVFEAPRDGDSWNTDPKDHDAAQEAARYANGLAEHAAEEEREWQAASSAGYRWAEAGEEAEKARTEALALLAERRKVRTDPTAFPAICNAIRAKVAAAVETIREARELRRRLAAGDGDGEDALMFFPRDPRLAVAFNESAGESVLAA